MTDARTKAAVNLANEIRPLLAGRGPKVQGAAIALLMATYLRGHPPDIRNQIFNGMSEAVFGLIDSMEEEP